MTRPCHMPNCPGEYEDRKIVRATRFGGQLIVIEGVPAEVCSFCGDTLFTPDTSATLERVVRTPPQPVAMLPLYRYPATDGVSPLADAASEATAHASDARRE